MDLGIPLDHSATIPLHRQLYENLRDRILNGQLDSGEKLPSTRALAEALHISRTTVTLCYEQLISEGYLETSAGSGTYVSRVLLGDLLPGDKESPKRLHIRLSEYGRHIQNAGSIEAPDSGLPVTFRPGRPDYEHFPMAVWRRLMLHHCRVPQPAVLDYALNSSGYEPLRQAIARYLSRSRGVRCATAQIIIVNGSQQALDMISRLLLDRGDVVALEDPCYGGARYAFESQGARLLPIPVDESGLAVDQLKSNAGKEVRLAYITPSHQFPTGYVLSLARRLELLDWAERSKAVIVEDDYDSEYRYAGRPLPSVQGLEENGRVLYVGTFSKVLFPSLRIGYLVVPENLRDVFSRAKWLADRQAPLLEQFVLTDFIQRGYLERHIRRMRRLYDQRRRTLVTALQQTLGKRVTIQGENAGMHLLVRFHTRWNPKELVKRARKEGVGLVSARPYYIKTKHTNEFVLGYANLNDAQIKDGVTRLAKAVTGH